ncbi:hypothetical protein [Halococcus sp. PRR34]|uniref:hypothetical protein n=1 Tax=Halococcus sp. PRR34 TaxID=3020830 RepID=UPI002362ED8B|nr:hypothetical protein [Halococcus sp. PRR34]
MTDRERNPLPSVEGVEFLLGASVYGYESGRVDIVSWGEHGGIGLVGYGGLRRLGEGNQEADDR